MAKPGIEFSLIDAKEYPVLTGSGYSKITRYSTRSKKNLRILMEAEREYLERLYELQCAIRGYFEPQMEDEPDEEEFTRDECWKIEEEVSKVPKRNEGIDNLYYT